MAHAFVPELVTLDDVNADLLVLAIGSEEVPLRGLHATLDWRLRGLLSRLVARGWVSTALGQATLVRPEADEGFRACILFGTGSGARLDERRIKRATEQMLRMTDKLRAPSRTLLLPGRSSGESDATAGLSIVANLLRRGQSAVQTSILESSEVKARLLPVQEAMVRRWQDEANA